jgi:hypothetical protein
VSDSQDALAAPDAAGARADGLEDRRAVNRDDERVERLFSQGKPLTRRTLERGQVDLAYLVALSEDALAVLIEQGRLSGDTTLPSGEDPLLQWNLGRARARAALEAH